MGLHGNRQQKKKKHKQKATAKEKKGTSVMEDKTKKILEKFFAKQLLWHLHLALSAVCALQKLRQLLQI